MKLTVAALVLVVIVMIYLFGFKLHASVLHGNKLRHYAVKCEANKNEGMTGFIMQQSLKRGKLAAESGEQAQKHVLAGSRYGIPPKTFQSTHPLAFKKSIYTVLPSTSAVIKS